MSEFADALGLPDTIRHAPWKRDKDGKPILGDGGKPDRLPERDYHLAPPDQLEVMGKWEQYLEQQAFAALQRRYADNPAMLQIKENDLTAAIVGGDYSVFGPVSVKAMTQPMNAHFRKSIYFRLLPYLAEREAEWIAEEFAKEQVSEIIRQHRQAAGQPDPNSKGPVREAQPGHSQPAPSAANGSQPSSPSSSTPESRTPISGAA